MGEKCDDILKLIYVTPIGYILSFFLTFLVLGSAEASITLCDTSTPVSWMDVWEPPLSMIN